MTVSLGDLEDFVREKVAHGEYESESEVLQEAVRLLKKRDESWRRDARAKIEEGMASIREGRTIPGDQAFAELRAWAEEQKRKHGL